MRIAIKDETFETIVSEFKKQKNTEIVEELLEAKEKHLASLTDNKKSAAQYAAQVNAEKTQKAVLDAIKSLKAKGVKITQKALAEESGISRQTVAKYYSKSSIE